MLNWFACFPAGRNTFSSWCALIAIRYAVKARGYWDHEVRSLLAAALSLPVMMLRDHLMWHWPLTWLFFFCMPASAPPSVFIRQISRTPSGELSWSSLLRNRGRLHCDTCQRGRKWSDSLSYISQPPPLRFLLLLLPPSLYPPSAWDQSITQSVFFHRRCSWHLHTCRRERWIPETRRQFDNVILISPNWKMALRGRSGRGTQLPCQSVKCTNLIWTRTTAPPLFPFFFFLVSRVDVEASKETPV